jgi:hypothetical protein
MLVIEQELRPLFVGSDLVYSIAIGKYKGLRLPL